MASTGAPITKSMGVSHTTLRPDGTHKDSRIRGVTLCVGYKNTDTGAIIPSPAATAASCSAIEFVRNSYAVGRATEDFGIREPGASRFDLAVSKNFSIAEGSKLDLGDEMNLQIRADLLNAFSHPTWDEDYNNDPASIDFGTIGKGPNGPTNTPRYLQLSARVSW